MVPARPRRRVPGGEHARRAAEGEPQPPRESPRFTATATVRRSTTNAGPPCGRRPSSAPRPTRRRPRRPARGRARARGRPSARRAVTAGSRGPGTRRAAGRARPLPLGPVEHARVPRRARLRVGHGVAAAPPVVGELGRAARADRLRELRLGVVREELPRGRRAPSSPMNSNGVNGDTSTSAAAVARPPPSSVADVRSPCARLPTWSWFCELTTNAWPSVPAGTGCPSRVPGTSSTCRRARTRP